MNMNEQLQHAQKLYHEADLAKEAITLLEQHIVALRTHAHALETGAERDLATIRGANPDLVANIMKHLFTERETETPPLARALQITFRELLVRDDVEQYPYTISGEVTYPRHGTEAATQAAMQQEVYERYSFLNQEGFPDIHFRGFNELQH